MATLLVLGGVLWSVAWALNAGAVDGETTRYGLREGDSRALLNPAYLLTAAGFFAWFRSQGPPRTWTRRIGEGLILAGLSTGFLGNVLEWGIEGGAPWHSGPGWALFLLAHFLLLPAGFLTMAAAWYMEARHHGVVRGLAVAAAVPLVPLLGFAWIWLGFAAWTDLRKARITPPT